MIKTICAAVAFTLVMSSAVAEARDYPVALTYTAPASVQSGEPTIALVTVTDERPNSEPHRVGAVRSKFGNPHRTLVTEALVSDVVATAIRDGLTARNLLADSGRHRLAVQMTRFDCNQIMPKEAHVFLILRLEDVATGAVLHQGEVRSDKVQGGYTFGIPGVEPLRALMNEAMQEAIDQALDEPAFRAALAGAPAAASETSPPPAP